MMRRANCLLYISIFLLLYSCSTTKVIPFDESRLKKNVIKVENSKSYSISQLQNYIKQKPNTYFIFGWNPFMNVYNWSNGKNKGWDKFVKKLGQAPVIFDKELVKTSCENLDNHLKYQGYYNNIITDSIVTKRKKTTVYYNVKLGDTYTIDSISYNIKDSILRKLFYADTMQSIIKKGSILSENSLNNESERISNIFLSQGFYGFNKNYFFFNADTIGLNGKANLSLSINDYTRNESPSDSSPHRVFYFNNIYINPIRNLTVVEYDGDLTNVKQDTIPYKGINIVIPPGKPLLRKNIVSKMNLVKSGEKYDQEIISKTYRRFTEMKLFRSVNVQLQEMDTNLVNCDIKLISSVLQGYKINLEASTNSSALFGISPSLSYYHKNLFRGGELFTLSFKGDFQFEFKDKIRSNEFAIGASLNIPNFLFIPDKVFKFSNIPTTDIAFSYNYQDRPEYKRSIISGKFGYSWSIKDRFFYSVYPLQINIVKLYNLSEKFYESLKDPFLRYSYQNHFDIGLGSSFLYTTNSATNPTTSYFYMRWQNDLSGNIVSLFNPLMQKNIRGERTIWGSPYSQYYKTEVSAVYTWMFGKENNQAIATRVLAGAGTGYGNSKALPFEKLFWSGGAYSLRAWQARTVGPGYAQLDTTFSIPNQTGDIRLEANIEYRFPLFWNFDGAVFMDAGNVWNLKRDMVDDNGDIVDQNPEGIFKFSNFYKHIACDWGVGVRLNLGFALLRVDMGMKVYNPPTNEWMGPNSWLKKGNYGVQFGVGYPF